MLGLTLAKSLEQFHALQREISAGVAFTTDLLIFGYLS